MQFKDMLKELIKRKGKTQTEFAATVGTTQSAIGNALKRNDAYISTLIKWCELNGYEVVVQERKPGKRRDDQMVLSLDQKEE